MHRPLFIIMLLLACCLTASAIHAQATLIEDVKPRAIQELLDASRSESAQVRMHAIEAAQSMPDRALPMIQLALNDPNPAVRFAALVTLGRLEFRSLSSHAMKLADDTEQPGYVRAAAAFAAQRTGKPADMGLIAALLWDTNPGQRANAALLLGLSNERSAIPMLRDAAKAPLQKTLPVRRELLKIQIAEALVQLGSEEELQVLRGAAYSSENEVRVLAILALGRQKDAGMRGNFINFLAKDPLELRLAAAEALARIGSDEGLPIMRWGAEHDLSTIRSQAAVALGQLKSNPVAADLLLKLLADPAPTVRIAAAASILESFDTP